MIVNPEASLSHLEAIPDDVFGNIVGRLDLADLLGLQQVCKTLHNRLEVLGIPLYLSSHSQSHLTLDPPARSWTPRELVRYHHHINRSLRRRRWHALQLGPTWRQSAIPTLSLSPTRLILGVGGRLLIHALESVRSGGKSVGRAREYMVTPRDKGSEADIIGAISLPNDEIAVAQYDGTLQRFRLHPNGALRSTAHYHHPRSSNLHTFTAGTEGEILVTATSGGLVSVFTTRSPWVPPQTFEMQERAWSSLASTRHPHLPPAIYIGVTGGIHVHPLRSSGPDASPGRILTGPDLPTRSSPYDMTFPSEGSVQHPSMLLSSWFDSYLRIHDLRIPSRAPVSEFFDPWQWADGSAIYSTTYLAEHHIAGGGARHGTVSLFDIRQPKSGWSIFSPGGKGSPVYALQGEGGRLWGVTERRAFVLAFDDSGDKQEGLVMAAARAPRERARDRVSGWKGRGGKWAWTVRYDEVGEGCTGYDHSQNGVALFESLPVV